MRTKDNNIKAVGYIRVSTKGQETFGEGLEKQSLKIREWCKRRHIQLLGIFEDTASAVDKHSYSKRPGLQQAHKLALSEQAILVVFDPTRLFRNPEAAEYFFNNMPKKVYSIKNKRHLGQPKLREAFSKGGEHAANIKKGTQKGLNRVKASGRSLGNPKNLNKSLAASIDSRRHRAQQVLEEFVAILKEDKSYQDLTRQGFADLLNRRGILSGAGNTWTSDSVRAKRKEAMSIIKEQEQLEAQLDAEETAISTQQSKEGAQDNKIIEQTEEEAERAELEQLEHFGTF